MSMCLNPVRRHTFVGHDPTNCLCPEPDCGFLLEGASIHQWSVLSLLKKSPITELYLAGSPSTSVVVRVLRSARSEILLYLASLQNLSHPHIHPLLAVEEIGQGGTCALLSHFETRGSLARLLEANTILPFPLIAGIIQQIAEALSTAHARQIVHGNLKAENCLLTAPGVLQVCDFYKAFFKSAPGAVSTRFIAPEQRQGKTLPASDQFALATLAYLLLRQRSPFVKRGPVAWTANFQGVIPEPFFLSTHPLDQILKRALSQEPGERFPDIRTFAASFCMILERIREAPGLPEIGHSPFPARPSASLASGSQPLPADETPGRERSSGTLPFVPPFQVGGTNIQERPSGPLPAFPSSQTGAMSIRERASSGSLPMLSPPSMDGLNQPPGKAQAIPPPASSGRTSAFPAAQYQKRLSAQAQEETRGSIPTNVTQVGLLPGHTATISALAWERSGRFLVSGSEDGEIHLWTFQGHIGRMEGVLQGQKGKVQALGWSPDGTALASASSDSALRIWNSAGFAAGQRQVETSWWGHSGATTTLDWSADSTMLASGGKDGTLRCWNRKGELLLKQQAHSNKGVRSLAWSPNQVWIATGGLDQTICVWNTKAKRQTLQWRAHLDEVHILQWSPDSRFLASAAGKKDTRILLWDIHTGKCVATLAEHQREIVGLHWSSDAAWLASCSADGTLYFWRTDHLLEAGDALLQPGPPISLNDRPQIMRGSPHNKILVTATRALSLVVFKIGYPSK